MKKYLKEFRQETEQFYREIPGKFLEGFLEHFLEDFWMNPYTNLWKKKLQKNDEFWLNLGILKEILVIFLKDSLEEFPIISTEISERIFEKKSEKHVVEIL